MLSTKHASTTHALIGAAGFLAISIALFYAATRAMTEAAPQVLPAESAMSLKAKLLTANDRYWAAPAAKRHVLLSEMFDVAKERKENMQNLLHANPQIVLGLLLTSEEQRRFPKELSALLEQPIVAEGYLSIVTKAKNYYLLRTAEGGLYWLYFAEPPLDIESDTRVRVVGTRLHDNVIVSEIMNF